MGACERFEREFLEEWEGSGEIRDEHVRECVECSQRYRSYRLIAGALRADDAPELPAEWEEQLIEHVRARSHGERAGAPSQFRIRHRPVKQRWWLVAAPALALAAGALLFVNLWRGSETLPGYVASVEGGA